LEARSDYFGYNRSSQNPGTAMTSQKRPPDATKVLIIDDDRNITLAMKEILRGRGYANVLSAATSAEGLQILADQGEEISLLILDMRMPDLDGLSVVSRLLDVHRFPLAVIMVTAYGSKQKSAFLRFSSNTVFAACYIEKPFDNELFVSEVGNAMKKAQALRSAGHVV
jgi:two-component system KDP operon response regulator KdpE